jgi:hypothetical protein
MEETKATKEGEKVVSSDVAISWEACCRRRPSQLLYLYTYILGNKAAKAHSQTSRYDPLLACCCLAPYMTYILLWELGCFAFSNDVFLLECSVVILQRRLFCCCFLLGVT